MCRRRYSPAEDGATLLGEDRRDRHVRALIDHVVVGDLGHEPQLRGRAKGRGQKAGLTRDAGRRVTEPGRVCDRDAEQLHARVTVGDRLRLLVQDHVACLDLPQRPALALIAKRAGRVDGVLELDHAAARAVGAVGGDAGIVLEQHADRLDKALLEVARYLHLFAKDRVPVGLDQDDVAGGEHLVGALVVADLIRQETALAGTDLDVARGSDDIVLGVVGQGVGGQDRGGLGGRTRVRRLAEAGAGAAKHQCRRERRYRHRPSGRSILAHRLGSVPGRLQRARRSF